MDCKGLIDVAAGRRTADLLLEHCRIVDVFGHRIIENDVALWGGRVAGVGQKYRARRTIDLGGRYLAPGFIDAHIHLESSMLLPAEFARLAAARGTTLCVCDPHEIANVMGLAGIRLLARLSRRLPVEFRFSLPSCVPASPLETSGHSLSAAQLSTLAGEPWVAGLAEVMNFPGVVAGSAGLLAKLALVPGQPLDGHAPGLTGQSLAAYLACGISSDHECTTAAEAAEKLSAGCQVMIREGSTARNLAALLPLVRPETLPRLMLVSDDLSPEELLEEGHLDRILRRARALGADPISLIRMVTLNPALYFGLPRRGAVAPGYIADLCVLDDLEGFRVSAAFKAGRQSYPLSADNEPARNQVAPRSSMRLAEIGPEIFGVAHRPGQARVIQLVPGQIVTLAAAQALPERGGAAVADPSRDLVKLAVIERHGRSGHGRGGGKGPNIGIGFVQGLGLRRGALASTVAHDSHNLIVAGVDDADMARAANALIECGGGQAAVAGGRVLARLPLPLAGLMSTSAAEEVVAQERALLRAARELGCQAETSPFMALSFLALPVIPALKLTDLGLVDVGRFEVVPLWV
jgi:adenine deaminase